MRPFGLNLVLDPAKEKEKESGKKRGSPKEDVQGAPLDVLIGGLPLDMRTLITCLPLLLSLLEMLRIEDSAGKKESLFKGMLSRMSVRLIGEGENARPTCNLGHQHAIRQTLPIVSGIENAWTGQHPAPPAPPAENRYYRRNVGNQAEYRGRDDGWHPTIPPTNLNGRQRTRTPRGNNRAPGPDTRVFFHDGNTAWEVVDDDDWWEEQNQRSQHRRNVEYQMERAD